MQCLKDKIVIWPLLFERLKLYSYPSESLGLSTGASVDLRIGPICFTPNLAVPVIGKLTTHDYEHDFMMFNEAD